MLSLGLYALLSAALFYLGSRALITKAIWSRYPPGLAGFMDCAACIGFWWGFALSLWFGGVRGPIFIEGIVVSTQATALLEAICTGLMLLVLTPIVAGFMQHGLDTLGTAEPIDNQRDS